MYKLVALDLDGTLLGEDYSIDPRALKAIEEAAGRGVSFTIATGRMHASARRFADILGFEIPIITYNGSVVRCAISGEEYRHLRVERETARAAFELVKGDRLLRYAFLDDRIVTDTPDEWTDRYAQALGVTMEYAGDLSSYLESDPTMVVFMCGAEQTKALTDFLARELDSTVRLTNSNPWFVDVLNIGASKALALDFLADRLGVSLTETIAIGDSWNDLEMIEAAGLGVAVANATEKLRERADYVTLAERGRGVAEAIEKFVLSS